MKSLVVDDDVSILETAELAGAICVNNAEDGEAALASGLYNMAFLDINGIQKNGKDVKTLIATCRTNAIEFYITSGDIKSCDELAVAHHPIRFVTKLEMLQKVAGRK